MDHMGVLSIVPVIIAITVAIKYKSVVPALFLGILSGVLILMKGHPIEALTSMIKDYLFVQVADTYNAGVLVLLVFIGGFVALMEKSGGAGAFAKVITKIVNNRFKAQLSTWLGGIVVFFSDLGTPLIVGPISEPLFDRLKISREKLAWIIDSTASPVAILVPFIGWGVYIMGLIQKEFDSLGILESDWNAFIKAIPFQLYSILAVLMVPIIAFLGYEFGAMAKAEKRVQETGEKYWKDSKPLRSPSNNDDKNSKAIFIWLPLLILFTTLLVILLPLGFPIKKVSGSIFRAALSSGYLLAAVTLILLMVTNRVKTLNESLDIYFGGMNKMMSVSVILVLAWSLGSVGKSLGTANYIIEMTNGAIPGWSVPALIFLTGALMSFATGSAWGTFAILMPLAIPMSITLGAPIYACIGALLSGGLFGDHCSPISDTTILSSTGAGCDHIDHVKTQLPYALLNGSISFLGFILAGITGNSLIILLALVALILSIIILAKYKGIKIDNLKIEEL